MTDSLPFTLRQLQYALAVAEQRSFGKAALRCHVAQPSLSQQVAALESALGFLLFERNARNVRCTSAGEAFLARAGALLRDAADLAEAARRGRDPLSGVLRLGVIPTLAPYLLPAAAMRLRAAFPHLRPLWREDKTGPLLEALRAGDLDAALLAEGPELGDLQRVPLFTDRFLLILPTAHPLAAHPGPVRADQLADESVLLLDDGHCLRDQALPFCGRAGLRESAFRATSLSTLVHLVASGEGLTLLPELALAVEGRRNDVAVRRLAPPEPSRVVVLAWRPASALSPSLGHVARALVRAP